MEKTVKDDLTSFLENLNQRDLKKFKTKLEDECKSFKVPITMRAVDLADDESGIADLLVKTFGEENAVNKTVEILKFIECNNNVSQLRMKYPEKVREEPNVRGATTLLLEGIVSSLPVSCSTKEHQEYTMKSKPRGTCVIFNNVNFDGMPNSKREGSDKDADNLKRTFEWLGFHVEILKDRTAQEINDELEELRKKVTGDCFVCCVLSHGNTAGVKGCDNASLKIRDIYSPFSGTRCPALKGKPKVFFIQACQGCAMQAKVNMDEQQVGPEADGISVDLSTADFADFLIAMSTFEGHYSIRNTQSGSWFIRSLCEHLTKLCPQGTDILTILTEVNKDVSAKEAYIPTIGDAKQIPGPMFTLTKKLVFPVPE